MLPIIVHYLNPSPTLLCHHPWPQCLFILSYLVYFLYTAVFCLWWHLQKSQCHLSYKQYDEYNISYLTHVVAVGVYIYHTQSDEVYSQGEESEGFSHHMEIKGNSIFPSFLGSLDPDGQATSYLWAKCCRCRACQPQPGQLDTAYIWEWSEGV